MLEYNLIKAHRPRFNVRLDGRQELPVPGGHPRRGVAAGDGDARRQAQGRPLLRSVRPRLRDPRDARPVAAHLPDPHLLGQQVRPARAPRPAVPAVPHRKCGGPCIGDVDQATYRELRARADRLPGRRHRRRSSRASNARCARPPTALDFERAARLRDRLAAVRMAIERQQMVVASPEEFDVVGIAESELEAAVQVFHVRRGRMVGRKGFVLEKVEPLTEPRARGARPRAAVRRRARSGCRSEVLVPELPDDADGYGEWLADRRGGRVAIHVPQRGRKRALLDMARAQRRRAAPAPPDAALERPDEPRQGPRRAAGALGSSSKSRRCASSATT